MSDSESSHVPQAAMATPREPTGPLSGYHDISPNNYYHPDRLLYVSNARINCDKELPPMPRLLMEEEPEDTVYGQNGREEDYVRQRLSSWMDMDSGSESDDLDFLRSRRSAVLPPSLLSRNSVPSDFEPEQAPSAPVLDESWSPGSPAPDQMHTQNQFRSEASIYVASATPQHIYNAHSPLSRSVSEGESSFLVESPPTRSFARPPKGSPVLPDPSQFPDPYPFRSPHHHLISTTPALSSAGSSSASTRSSAYTSSGSALASGDYGHVHVATGEEEEVGVAVGITSDDVVQLMASDSHASSSAFGSQSRVPIDQTRWSEYSASIRSRSSSAGHSNTNSMYENTAPRLTQKPSYDMGWQTVDERDEAGLLSEEETDDEPGLGDDLDDEDEEEKEEERTAAILVAEEGRGLIVRGDGIPLLQLQVEPGTTHLLVGSSSTPNAMPTFLANTLPQICNTLLALDISANFLVAVPPALASCTCLEELNLASNPLRVLPVFLSHLTSLRVLIADSTGISTLPETFSELDKLHTLSVRRNKMHALPSWLCLLFSLQTLYVDGNPFQGPWKALVEPLLAKVPMTPMYPPSTPMWPLPSASLPGSSAGTETDVGDFSDPPTSDGRFAMSPEEEDTIMPHRAPSLRATTAPSSAVDSEGKPLAVRHGLTRTRTAPNRVAYNKSRVINGTSMIDHPVPASAHQFSSKPVEDSGYFGDQRELRRMKSAGEIRGNLSAESPALDGVLLNPSTASSVRPGLTQYGSSASSSNLLNVQVDPDLVIPQRLASLSVSSRGASNTRPAFTQSLWDNISESGDDPTASPESKRTFSANNSNTSGRNFARENRQSHAEQSSTERHSTLRSRDGKDKGGRKWGFLKKMSMGKMRIDSPTSSGRSTPMNISGPSPNPQPSYSRVAKPDSPSDPSTSPRINMRISTTGALGALSIGPGSTPSLHTIERKPSNNALKAALHTATVPSPSGFVPATSKTSKAAKRRSFLPIDTPPLNIPEPSTFVLGLTASNDDDNDDAKKMAGSIPDVAELSRREEEKLRESSTRALRSVMAYLKDMNDLNQTQTNSPSTYGSSDENAGGASRSRRPTIVDRGVSDGSISRTGSSGQLRSLEVMAGLRDGNTTQTMSVATTDSSGSGSGEERKFKDDKSKRAMVVREIVETERTYVKGLAELVDLYIKPGAAPVNMLSGVGSNKDTVVPVAERKIVFNGLDALFSFHKDNFLPALEVAAAPMMKPAAVLQEADSDGQLSLNVGKAVASMFLKHAAFMRMYSSYINNFDNSLQRVKYWSSDRLTPAKEGSPSAMLPGSSTTQLVGLGLTMSAVSNPGMTDSGSISSNGMTNLTTSQKKRIKSYLKRCRMSPRHSQLNLEGYLLLPVQRIPRYRLLLEELVRSTPPSNGYIEDPLDKALVEITSLANSMNEGKRESESRRKLVQWQSRIRGRFPSPLVQPHRRLIMDGPLLLTRVVRKAMVSFEVFNALGDMSTVQVDCLAPELTPRALVGILCNDLLVLCRDPSEGKDSSSPVDLWAVLRMQTLPQPASIVHGNALRLVDNKAILYFDAPSPSDALNWYRAINLHIPDSKA